MAHGLDTPHPVHFALEHLGADLSQRSSGRHEVAPHFSLDEHTAVPDVLLIGTRAWDQLSSEERGWLSASIRDSVIFQRTLWQKATTEALAAVQAAGVDVTRPPKEPFVQRVSDLRRGYPPDTVVGELVERIVATQ